MCRSILGTSALIQVNKAPAWVTTVFMMNDDFSFHFSPFKPSLVVLRYILRVSEKGPLTNYLNLGWGKSSVFLP